MNLIDEVLEAQAEFERRKAAYQAHPSQHAQEDEYEAEAILNELATTAAPKLARALDNTKKKLAVLERLTVGGTIGDIAREILAEIEKELSNG